MEKNKTVEGYLAKRTEEQVAQLNVLRSILQRTVLEEGVKWGAPVYMLKGKNVVGMAAFKSYVGLWFHNGVYLKDEAQKLINAQEDVTKALRQWRFTSLEEIQEHEDLIHAYILEAIENQKAGKELKPKKTALVIPELLQKELNTNAQLNTQYKSLTPYKQKEYAEYISSAKREATQQSRLEKVIPMILEGKGLNDRYRTS
ncbi:Uncharacterized conserved protein YdeI, YjbR/CyaY-like superfamily, DUF1801 family [Lishizhenia tianjinensis]|uniref:Uncharacterized conserved protein YdeI, YjbR/CyaY-like superfamily, DUF1801 family n=1 Tax=Lishizhenia tianjinensis TaxID=477690 RepID=A0A1I6XKE3_9FLAO|nr:YdeI/OmpD-associated family protein [Lishizhenia tianjinensis]SFT38567.1 Uncharacterized conserved protein YdeI, YjbR/CyaY-like superfamily, DUF1801 family [Lishizhenia tianjinensis]